MIFRDAIKNWIDSGKFKFLEKAQMLVDTDPFSTTTVNMVNAYVPKRNGQQWVMVDNNHSPVVAYVPRQSPQPRLKNRLESL